MELRIFNDPPEKWNEYVDNHPNGRIYHLTQWNELIRNSFRNTIKYITMENGSGLGGILPLTEFQSRLFGKFSVSLPFVNYGGPLVNNSDQYLDIAHFLASYQKKENFDFTIVHLGVDIDRIFTVPGRIELIVPDSLQPAG